MERLAFAFCLILLLISAGIAQDSMNVRRVGVFASLAGDVKVRGGYAYLVGDSMFRVISMADPEHPPVEVGSVGVPGTRLAVQGDYAYVASDSERLRVVSIADPANPVEVGRCDIHRAPQGVAVSGDYVYVAATDSGLGVISVADPTNPVEVARIDTIGLAYAVAVSGNHAYVFGEALSVVEISDPEHPVTLGRCNIRSWATYGDVSGYYAYVVTYTNGLVVIRVADPSHPVQVWQQNGGYGGVAVASSYLYVGAKGVKVFSLADPGSPAEIGHYTITGTAGAAGVAADDDCAYVACSWAGLQMFQYYGPGVEETANAERRTSSGATILSPASAARHLASGAVFDALGRRVMAPRSGVFFMRQASSVMRDASYVTKVVVPR